VKRWVKTAVLSTLTILSAFYFLIACVALTGTAPPLADSQEESFLWEGAICAGVAVWSAVTAVGIARLREWARVSMLWIGPAAILGYLLDVANYISATAPNVYWDRRVTWPLVPIAALTIWWLVLFTRPAVKRAFGWSVASRDLC
jgi:hypothetical protein